MPQPPSLSVRQRQRARQRAAKTAALDKLENLVRAHRKENKRNGKVIADLRAHVELLNTTASRSSQSSAEDTRKIADQAALIDRCAACIKKRERENPHLMIRQASPYMFHRRTSISWSPKADHPTPKHPRAPRPRLADGARHGQHEPASPNPVMYGSLKAKPC